CAKKEDDFEYW
nr:immunoglobulin heavy chain junction region [Macaca mulatta]